MIQQLYSARLTELEIVQASFRKKYDHGYFYFRDPGHLDDKLEEASDEDCCQQLQKTYLSESTYAAKKLRELKQQIIDTELPVKYFRTLQELGEHVIQDWFAVINTLFPPMETNIFDVQTELFDEWRDHETYALDFKHGFVKTPDVTKIQSVMNQHGQAFQPMLRRPTLAFPSDMEVSHTFLTSIPSFDGESAPSILVICGERGSGKTTVVSTWIDRFIDVFPEATVISHFVGCNASSFDVMNFMKRCTNELRDRYKGSHSDLLFDLKDLNDYGRVKEAFSAAVSLGPSVIVIDGINQIQSNTGIATHVIKEMKWLPKVLPEFCRVIITTTTSDLTYRALSQRKDACILQVQTLQDNKSRSEVFQEHLGEADHLHFQIEKIISAELGELPLFYVALANEMKALAASKTASDKQIDLYLHAASLSELWGAILRRWTHDYSWLVPTSSRGPVQTVKTQVSKDKINNGWVADMLRLVAISKQGLSEDEILGVLSSAGYVENYEVSSAPLALLLTASLGPMKKSPAGMLNFSNQTIKEAVCATLLANLTLQDTPVSTFHNPWEKQKKQCHLVLVSYISNIPPSPRVVDELPWQLKLLGDMNKLCEALLKPQLFVPKVWFEKYPSRKMELVQFWAELIKKKFKVGESYYKMFVEAQQSERIDPSSDEISDQQVAESIASKSSNGVYSAVELSCLAFCAGKFLLDLDDFSYAETLLIAAFQHGHATASFKELSLICEIEKNLGDLYSQVHLNDQAKYWYQMALKTAQEVSDGPGDEGMDFEPTLGHLLDALAMIDVQQIKHEKPLSAIRPSSRSAQASLQLVPRSQMLDMEGPEGMLAQALKHAQLAQVKPGEARIEYHFGHLKIKEGRFLEAHTYFHRALQTFQTWYGVNHPSVADVLDDLAGILCHPANFDLYDKPQAEELYRKALAVRESTLGKSHIKVAQTLYHLGKLLQSKGTKDAIREAKELLQRALDVHINSLGVYHIETKEVRKDLKKLEGDELTAYNGTAKPLQKLKPTTSSGSVHLANSLSSRKQIGSRQGTF